MTAAGSSSRNIVRSSGAISFSSAATSSCAIAFSSVSCCLERQVLEGRRRVLARQQPEDDDLILDGEIAEQLGEMLGGRLRIMSRSFE